MLNHLVYKLTNMMKRIMMSSSGKQGTLFAPSKTIGFCWKLMLDRIQTRDNVRRRNLVTSGQLLCPLCNLEENLVHLLFSWSRIYQREGWCLFFPRALVHIFGNIVVDGVETNREEPGGEYG